VPWAGAEDHLDGLCIDVALIWSGPKVPLFQTPVTALSKRERRARRPIHSLAWASDAPPASS